MPSLLGVVVQPPRTSETLLRPAPQPNRAGPTDVQIRFRRALGQAMRREWVTDLLIALNVAVFAWMVVSGVDVIDPSGQDVVTWGANYGPLTRGGEWWRLATSMFVHGGLMHLGVNMYSLYAVGRTVERIFGHAAYALLYLFAGLAGSAASVLVHPDAPSVGASGAIFGVVGALIAFLVRRRALLPVEVLRPLWRALVVTVLFNVGFGFSVAGIDNAAHFGGLAGGFLAGLALVPAMDGDRLRRPWIAYPVVALGCVVVVLAIGLAPLSR